jgi:hypothetical protein
MKNQLLIMKRNQLNLGNLIKSNLLDQLCKLLSRIKKKKKKPVDLDFLKNYSVQ